MEIQELLPSSIVLLFRTGFTGDGPVEKWEALCAEGYAYLAELESLPLSEAREKLGEAG